MSRVIPGTRLSGKAVGHIACCLALMLAAAGCGGTSGHPGGETSTTLVAQGSSTVSTGPATGSEASATGGHAGNQVNPITSRPALFRWVSREEVKRRLDLPPLAIVAEFESSVEELTARMQSGTVDPRDMAYGRVALVDSVTDTLALHPWVGVAPSHVAVHPDGTRAFLSDLYQARVRVVDPDSGELLAEIPLENLTDRGLMDVATTMSAGPYEIADAPGATGPLAVTPDGRLLLVATVAGLQVIDLQTNHVERVLPALYVTALAVSFDGTRAYLGTCDWRERGAKTIEEWNALARAGEGGGMAVLDLETMETIREVPFGLCMGMAFMPDGSAVYASDCRDNALHALNPATLTDIAVIPTDESEPRGVGILPDGAKAYVVCQGQGGPKQGQANPFSAQSGGNPEGWFCGVVETAANTMVKKIPLDSY